MNCRLRVLMLSVAAGLVAVVYAQAGTGAEAVRGAAGWKLAWSDEFVGDAVDRKKWAFDVGTGRGGWGNRELQSYTDRPDNAYVAGGLLHIRAVREAYDGAAFTSARLNTRGLFSKKYGRFEIRAKLPTGKGVWPAIWMLPEENKYGPWPASGEIDILEARGQEPGKVPGTLHYGTPHAQSGKDYALPDGGTIADFHVYALEWEPGEIRWSVDDHVYQVQNFWWSATRRGGRRGREAGAEGGEVPLNAWPAPFDQPFHLLLNVAVGGNFLGNPDDQTKFPVEMVVDYVRVYDRAGEYGDLKPRGAGKLPGK